MGFLVILGVLHPHGTAGRVVGPLIIIKRLQFFCVDRVKYSSEDLFKVGGGQSMGYFLKNCVGYLRQLPGHGVFVAKPQVNGWKRRRAC